MVPYFPVHALFGLHLRVFCLYRRIVLAFIYQNRFIRGLILSLLSFCKGLIVYWMNTHHLRNALQGKNNQGLNSPSLNPS
jgi:hypothetical protein